MNLEQFYRLNIEAEPILVPKRRYRRPDLQRLANRWYGMMKTGDVMVRAVMRPTSREIRIPIARKMDVNWFLDEPPSPFAAPAYDVKIIKLFQIGLVHHVTEKVWNCYRFEVVERMRRELIANLPVDAGGNENR